MGKKGAMPNFKTVDDYIANQTVEAQVILNELRKLIKGTVKFQFNKPLPKELIKQMVVYRKNELLNK